MGYWLIECVQSPSPPHSEVVERDQQLSGCDDASPGKSLSSVSSQPTHKINLYRYAILLWWIDAIPVYGRRDVPEQGIPERMLLKQHNLRKRRKTMEHVRDLLRQLAAFDPGDTLVLSVYLDLRPHGGSPAIRPSLMVLKDRFRAIEKPLLPRGAALDNFRSDANGVQRFLDEHAGSWLQGIAIFACSSHQLFEVLETGVPFENQVVLESAPDLF